MVLKTKKKRSIFGRVKDLFVEKKGLDENGYFPKSKLALKLLRGLRGVEIGGSAHNSFGLDSLNVDYCGDMSNKFKQSEIEMCGEALHVDIVSPGDQLPFGDNVWDFVISSHVIEHFYDPIKTIKEWFRVIKPGGYIYMIVPHKERTIDKDRERTPLAELVDRHENPNPPKEHDYGNHYSVWTTEDFLELCDNYGWKVTAHQDKDDKVGNGFTIVLQK